jgi:hypothetical protein
MIFNEMVKKISKWAHNPKVRGSNPLPATNNKNRGLDEKSGPFFHALKSHFQPYFQPPAQK